MGDSSSSDTWKKLVIAKANDQWISIPNIKQETSENANTTGSFSIDYDRTYDDGTERIFTDPLQSTLATPASAGADSPRPMKDKKESPEERAARLAKMSAYAAQRLASESPEQRAARLKRMSEYAARRLASESSEQRAARLARMSAYAARRLASETPDQRALRLARMSAYAAKRHALKKINGSAPLKRSKSINESNETAQ